MKRYLLSEKDRPVSTDYYYEADHTTNSNTITVSTHSHNYYEIYMYIRGGVQIMLNNHIFPVRKGDVVIIPPFHLHSLIPMEYDAPYERMYLYITDTCLNSFQFNEFSLLKPLLDATKQGRYHFHIEDPKDFETINNAIDYIKHSKGQEYYGREMLNRSYIMQMFTVINSYIVKEVHEKLDVETSSLMSRVVAYLNDNFMEDFTIDVLCDLFFTNRQTMTRLFKEYTTLTIHNYITLMRITQAKQLIHEGTPPSKLHLLCGFNDYTTFYRAFKRIEGMTPQQYFEISHKG